MTKTRILAAASLAASLSLAACNNGPEVVNVSPDDPQAEALANAAPVELPPAIQSSDVYRCKDNSLLYATFYTNNTVKVSNKEGATAPGTTLTAPAPGQPYTAEGYSLSGSGDQITYTAPGKGTQTCKA